MKKQRKLKLEVNKVSVSKLNNIKGAGDPIESVDFPCILSINGFSCILDCQTGLTIINNSEARDC